MIKNDQKLVFFNFSAWRNFLQLV